MNISSVITEAGIEVQRNHFDLLSASAFSGATTHPFATDPADHCETPYEAYEHISPFLNKVWKRLAKHLRKNPSEVLIYDPYFCEGSMKEHLRKLGFNNVYNK
eukprot:scaffold45444_cov33-Prasinocladus_malaysianus.AAC.1